MGVSRAFLKPVLGYTQVKCVWSKIHFYVLFFLKKKYVFLMFNCRKSLPGFQHGFTLESSGELFIKMLSAKDTDLVELVRVEVKAGVGTLRNSLSNAKALGKWSIASQHRSPPPAFSQVSTSEGPFPFTMQATASFCSMAAPYPVTPLCYLVVQVFPKMSRMISLVRKGGKTANSLLKTKH